MAGRLVKNALLAVIPWLVPAVAAIIAIPITVRGLGDDSYGIIALVGAATGYLALTEIGIGRGVIRYTSMFAASGNGRALRQCVRVTLAWFVGAGVLGGAALYALAPWIVTSLLRVPGDLRLPAVAAFRIGGAAFALGAPTSLLSVLPKGFLRYDLVAVLQTTLMSASLLGPAAIVTLGYGLLPVMWFSVGLNAVAVVIYATVTARLIRGVPDEGPPFREYRRQFIGFVATEGVNQVWTLVQDETIKVVIGRVGGTSQAAYYQVSRTMMSRANGLLNNMASVLFPTIAQLVSAREHGRIIEIYKQSSRLLFLLNASMTGALVVFSTPLLRYWISPRYAAEAGVALALLMLAQSVGATSQAAGNLNSALGRPKVNLAFSVINSIVNLATVYWLTVRYGITGAAFSILLAALVMPAFVHYTNRKVLEIASWPVVRDCYLRSMLAATGVSTASWFLLRPLATSFTSTVLLTGLTASACVLCAYVIGVVKPEDRASLRAALRRSKPAVALDQ